MTLAFLLLGLISVVAALAVVIMRNPVHSALALIVNLLAVAGLFATLDAHFLAVAQVIVYAGAIMVLFVFVIMLLNSKDEQERPYGRLIEIVAGATALCFIAVVVQYVHPLFGDVSRGRDTVEGSVKAIGELLYTRYTYPFEIASILIIVALAGAVLLARRHYRKGSVPDSADSENTGGIHV